MDKEFQAHETAVIDAGCCIGRGTVVWHFSHLMSGCIVGERCSIGQNVVISPGVVLGDGVKVQNNVSVYTGVTCEDDVFLGPSCVFTNVINPRSAVPPQDEVPPHRQHRAAQEAAVAPRKKPPAPPLKSETDAKANKKITLCNNFAQLSLQSQQRCAQTRTSSPERQ